MKSAALDMMLELLRYDTLTSLVCVTGNSSDGQSGKKVAVSQRSLLKIIMERLELEMS